ncbi:unnamed protein product [Danaus chrysippus]|uniref:(African queen) hypothetical protein n=1 Tax=Danaus chrysippus TaxID=151541 RepID=A0A8J2QE07_9NEOP|nr:unnamed protein product [Danaus chrysippus]
MSSCYCSQILTLLPDREVNAAPEPCKEIVEFIFNTDRLRKTKHTEKESEEIDEREKRRKEKIKQLKKIDKVILGSDKEASEQPKKEPKGVMEEFMSGYLNFIKYVMSM